MRKAYRSIRTRLTLITVAFTLLATITLVGASMFQLQRAARTNLLQSIEFNLHLVAELIQGDIQLMDRLRRAAIIQPQTTRFLMDEDDDARLIRELLTRLTEDMMQNPVAYRYLRRLVVVDADLSRRVQVGFFTDKIALMPETLHLLGDFDQDAEPRWAGVKPDPLAMTDNDPVLYMISPVHHDGSVIGYIYLAASTDIISLRLSGYRPLEQGNLYLQVYDLGYEIADGRFIETPLDFAGAAPSGDMPHNAATAIRSYVSPKGGRYLAVTSPVGQTGLSLTQTIPEGLILQETYLVVRLIFVVCIGVLVMGVLVALYLSRKIGRPVRQIRRQVLAIAGGDFTSNPQIEWENEFGEIGRGINQLARDVDALIKSRIEIEKRKSDMEYKMLQSQINPHFLYNSLNSIKWMATIQNATGIAEITVSLSRLLKSIAKINQSVVPLSQELALLEDYFVISRYRYGDSITSHVNVPDELLGCGIPVFTLQPIVENAIFHGIEANDGIGAVTIAAQQADGMLEITIEDDGIGMDDETIREVLNSDGSESRNLFKKVGIHSVNARIQYEYGQDYGVSIESRKGEFTRVIVRLPLIILETEPEEKPLPPAG